MESTWHYIGLHRNVNQKQLAVQGNRMQIVCRPLAHDNGNILVATSFLTCDRIGIRNPDFIVVRLFATTQLAV